MNRRVNLLLGLDVLAVVWAAWTFYVQALVYSHASFSVLRAAAVVPLTAGLLCALWVYWRGTVDDPPVPDEPPADSRQAAVCVAVVAGLLVIGRLQLPFQVERSIYAAVGIGALLWALRRPGLVPAWPRRTRSGPERTLDATACGVALAIAAFHTVTIANPGSKLHDDSFYVGTAVAALDAPGHALLRLDPYHLVDNPLVQYMVVHRAQTYELTLAFVSSLTGIAVPTLYFEFAAVAALLIWAAVILSFASRLPVRYPGMVFLVLVLLLLVSIGTLGRHDFVRLFRGKTIFVAVIVPWMWLSAWLYAQRPTLVRWVVLAAVQVLGVGLTVSAGVVGPIAALLALASSWVARVCTWRAAAAGLLASLWAVWPLTFVLVESAGQDFTGQASGGRVFVGWSREAVALGMTALLPVLLRGSGRSLARPLAAAGVIAVVYLLPMTGDWLSLAVKNLAQRHVWAVPVPFLVAVAVVGILQSRWNRLAVWAGTLVVLVAFAGVGRWAVNPGSVLRLTEPIDWVPADMQTLAAFLTSITPRSEVVVAPQRVSNVLVMTPMHPRLLLGRKLTPSQAAAFGWSRHELAYRRKLVATLDGRRDMPADALAQAVLARGVHTVALRPRDARADTVADLLETRGYGRRRVAGHLVVSRGLLDAER